MQNAEMVDATLDGQGDGLAAALNPGPQTVIVHYPPAG
jgi:hypothetical protein